MLPTTRRRPLSLPRRASLLQELIDATPKTSGYTWRREVIAHHLEVCNRAMERAVQTNSARFFMETRRAFSHGLN